MYRFLQNSVSLQRLTLNRNLINWKLIPMKLLISNNNMKIILLNKMTKMHLILNNFILAIKECFGTIWMGANTDGVQI